MSDTVTRNAIFVFRRMSEIVIEKQCINKQRERELDCQQYEEAGSGVRRRQNGNGGGLPIFWKLSHRGRSSSSIVSFAGDTRLYHGISNVDDYSFLQHDLNSVYDWASCNNMSFNAQKFQYIDIY